VGSFKSVTINLMGTLYRKKVCSAKELRLSGLTERYI
jgi:hypothetical protein